MTSTKSTKKVKKRRVTFVLEADNAREVSLMGDFNQWNINVHPMRDDGNGKWQKAVILPPGKYEYKFMVDGYWVEEPHNGSQCPNCFGTNNNVCNVTFK